MADQTTSQTPVATPVVATKDDIEKNKVIAAVTYVLFFLPYLAAKDSKFAMFHANQSLVLLIASIAGGIILSHIPLIGWIISPLYSLAIFILWIMGIINALNGQTKELPVIGSIKILPQP